MIIRAESIHKSFRDTTVLKGIDLEIDQGEIVTLVGASGSGKTTFLSIIGTFEKPTSGKVFFEETDISMFPDSKLSKLRNQSIGFIFQFHNLLPEFSALENVFLPGLISQIPSKTLKKRAIELLDFFGLADKKNRKPHQLSGGEQQRVAFARALINQPKVILADEPTGNLDSQNSLKVNQLISETNKTFDVSFLIATHNKELADIGHSRRVIEDGVLQEIKPHKGG